MSDAVRRDLGAKSLVAHEALEAAIWRRSADTIQQAEAAYQAGELTAERAFTLLVALLEQRRLAATLEIQIEEGVRAAKRIEAREAAVAAEEKRAAQGAVIGRNRFLGQPGMPSRSKAAPKDAS